MRGAEQDDPQVHSEVEHLEDLALGEAEDDDASEFRQRDSGEDAAAHSGEGVGRPILPRRAHRRGEAVHQVGAEFDGNADSHHEIDQRDGVKRNVPEVHESAQIDDDHRYRYEDDDRGEDVQAHQQEGGYEDGGQADAHALQRVRPHGQVLFVEDIKHRVGKNVYFDGRFQLRVYRVFDVLGDLSGRPHALVIILGRLEYSVKGHEIRRTDVGQMRRFVHDQIHSLRVSSMTSFRARLVRIVTQEKRQVVLKFQSSRPPLRRQRRYIARNATTYNKTIP